MHEKIAAKSSRELTVNALIYIYRLGMFLLVVFLFIPGLNPARITSLVNENMSLFTSGISYSGLTKNTLRAITRGWVEEESFRILFIGSAVACIGIIGPIMGGCMSLGSLKLRRLGNTLSALGAVVSIAGLTVIYLAYSRISQYSNLEKTNPNLPAGFYIMGGIVIAALILSLILLLMQAKPGKDDVYEMEQKYKLFLIMMPFIALIFLFSYLPLWGWRYAFFDYKAGGKLTKDNFVGLKWFTFLFNNDATRRDIIRVMRNTLAMSGLGLATSWFAMAFAIFLCEIKNLRIRRFIQTFTTIPNFISWVLVYAFANLIFSSEGLISSLIVRNGGTAINFLMRGEHIWLKMLAWGLWKGMGWSAIIYIAGISGIDQQLYEAATVDGAGRFRRMWNVTVPGLLPTFFVLLLLQISGLLNNGMEQYLVFENPYNTREIMVLDLYIYKLGVNSGKIALTTVVGMIKSLISVLLLFSANRASKWLRGESIV